VVAGAVGSSVTQVGWYEDWGDLNLESDGWSSPVGFTGQSQDLTQGLVHNRARSYDTGTGSWTAADTWAGLLVQPKSLSRYGYVWDNPATYVDPDGHQCAKRGPGDALPLGCGAPPHQAYEDVIFNAVGVGLGTVANTIDCLGAGAEASSLVASGCSVILGPADKPSVPGKHVAP
jgi:RHS repeat-associated protein